MPSKTTSWLEVGSFYAATEDQGHRLAQIIFNHAAVPEHPRVVDFSVRAGGVKVNLTVQVEDYRDRESGCLIDPMYVQELHRCKEAAVADLKLADMMMAVAQVYTDGGED